MLRDNLVTARVFEETDPWLFSVLNDSLTTMKQRDEQLADAIDAGGGLGGAIVDIVGETSSVLRMPSSWSITKVSTGTYNITHSFGTVSYTVFPGVVSETPLNITISNLSSNSFTVVTSTSAGVLTDTRFSCFVTRYA